jgi:hypothetical protein
VCCGDLSHLCGREVVVEYWYVCVEYGRPEVNLGFVHASLEGLCCVVSL